jgi:hypothetical protein
MTDKKERIIISILLIAILITSSGSMVAFAKSNTHVVKPNGTDDTADIQAALNSCVGAGPQCTVQLMAGTYYTKQIAVNGFQGSFVGMGQGQTTIQALPDLPPPTSNTPNHPFWAAPPGSANPWPVLFTFVDGSFQISQMTFYEPDYSPISSPGWTFPGGSEWYALAGMIYFVGHQANVVMDHVTVQGAAGNSPYGYNINNGIYYEGFTLPNGYSGSNPLGDAIPLSGSILLTNSEFDTIASGANFGNLVGARVAASFNSFSNVAYALYTDDLSNTKAGFFSNRATSVSTYSAFWADQGVFNTNLLPSEIDLTGNNFQVGQGANAVNLFQYETTAPLSAVVSGNVFRTDTSCGCYGTDWYYSAVISSNLKSLSVSLNTITNSPAGGATGVYVTGGPATVIGNLITGTNTGVQVDNANGVHVAANVVRNSVQYGIALTDGSSSNQVTWNFVHNSGAFDLYWDGTGTGNIWHANLCQTSSPSGLC